MMKINRSSLYSILFIIVLIFSLFGTQGRATAKAAQVIDATATPLDIALAIANDPTWVTGASFVAPTVPNTANAVSDTPLTSFPTQGSTYGILTTGSATDVGNPGVFNNVDLAGPLVRGNTDLDVTILKIDLLVPIDFNCLTINFQFLSEEFPRFVGKEFNDAFIAELDNSTWSTSGSIITAPDNFAFDLAHDVVSINSTGFMLMSPTNGIGTAFDGGLTSGGNTDGAATILLSASSPITPGTHSLYLSIFDQGDHRLDSTVFLDNLMLGHVVSENQCEPGAKPPVDLSITKSDSPDPVTVGASLTYNLSIINNGPGDATGVTVTDTLPVGVTLVSSTPSQGTCTAGPVVTCDLGDLVNGASAAITINVSIDSTACGSNLTNTAVVESGVSDPDSSNNKASADTTVSCPCTILDDFNRANGPLGSNWDGRTSGYRIVNNEVAVRAGGPIYWQPAAYGADQEACVTLTRINPNGKQHALLLKVQEPNDWRQGAIMVSYNAQSGNVDVKVRDVTNHQWNLVGSLTPSTTVVDGDQLRAKAFADDTVEVLINDTSIGTVDAGSFYADKGGQIGLWFRGGEGNDDDDEHKDENKNNDNDDRDRLAQASGNDSDGDKDDNGEHNGNNNDDDSSSAGRAILDDFGGGTITQPALTDLTVALVNPPTQITCPGGPGTCVITVEFMITNTSSMDVTSSFEVLIEAEEVPAKTITVSGLAAGASQSFSETLGPGNNCYNPNCIVRVTVDSANAIPESNDTNNVAEREDIG